MVTAVVTDTGSNSQFTPPMHPRNHVLTLYSNNSSWNRWGRWVALVVIVGFFLILAFACS